MGRITLICLAVFLLLFGLDAVTNFEIVWMAVITGLAALAAGVLLIFNAFTKAPL